MLAVVCMSLGRMALACIAGVVLYYMARSAGAGLYYAFTWWRAAWERLAGAETHAWLAMHPCVSAKEPSTGEHIDAHIAACSQCQEILRVRALERAKGAS